MAKIIGYECEKCEFITKYKDEVFIFKGHVFNGDNELLHQSDTDEMLCFECLANKLGLLKISEESHDSVNLQNSNHNTIPQNLSIDDLSMDENNESEDVNTQYLISKIMGKVKESEIEESEIEESEIEESEIEESETIDESDIDEDETIEESNIDEDKIIEESETTNQANEVNADDNEVEIYDYIELNKILSDEDEKNLITKLGYDSETQYNDKTNSLSLKNICIPVSSGMYESELNEPITNLYNMTVESIFYNIIDGIPQIKKASVFMSEDGKTGYISSGILQQLSKTRE